MHGFKISNAFSAQIALPRTFADRISLPTLVFFTVSFVLPSALLALGRSRALWGNVSITSQFSVGSLRLR